MATKKTRPMIAPPLPHAQGVALMVIIGILLGAVVTVARW